MEGRVTLHLCSLLLFISLLLCSQPTAASRSSVKFLPGFHGPLPFHLETGYVGVGESEDVHLFYYFVRSEKDPKKDPLLLWLTGGPGCSGLSGLAFEIGPFNFKVEEYNGSLPSLVLNPNSWTKVSSIIFVDSPVGTGFSYARTPSAARSGDRLAANQTDEFFRKWLEEHPELLSNAVYLGGDSYSGITVPSTFKQMTEGNEAGIRHALNLKGSIGEWKRCNNGLPYTKDIPSSVPHHAYISTKGYRSLVYSGDHDMVVPYISTEEWIESLNYSIVEDWRSWKVDGQIGGYTRTYSNGMTYATVKGGGHTASEYRPRECFAMFQRWISEKTL